METPTLSSLPGVDQDRVLVVVQLSGGNDGLNTVVPFGDPLYYRARPSIGVPEQSVLRLGEVDGVGLHPSLAAVKELYDDGQCALVQGVGYPNPNRSHFKSMDIWHTADTSGTGDGWLGRYVDAECVGFGKGESGTAEGGAAGTRPEPPISLGREAPLATQGRTVKPVSFETPDLFRWTGGDVHESLTDPYHEIARRVEHADESQADSNASFLMRTALDAQVSSETIRRAVSARPLVNYPRTQLAQQLSMVGNMIRAGMKTRVYYVTHGGFDTHAGQGGERGRHAQLLQQFAEAVRSFYADLRAQDNDRRVMTMSFSEFGRRVGQNASGGTDHGTAAPMFLFGPMVKAGVHSVHPSLSNLDQGDLIYNTDFRQVYADVLEGWMQSDSEAVLEDRWRRVGVVG
jgi:uncharacterized protein (DUF1501 family)